MAELMQLKDLWPSCIYAVWQGWRRLKEFPVSAFEIQHMRILTGFWFPAFKHGFLVYEPGFSAFTLGLSGLQAWTGGGSGRDARERFHTWRQKC